MSLIITKTQILDKLNEMANDVTKVDHKEVDNLVMSVISLTPKDITTEAITEIVKSVSKESGKTIHVFKNVDELITILNLTDEQKDFAVKAGTLKFLQQAIACAYPEYARISRVEIYNKLVPVLSGLKNDIAEAIRTFDRYSATSVEEAFDVYVGNWADIQYILSEQFNNEVMFFTDHFESVHSNDGNKVNLEMLCAFYAWHEVTHLDQEKMGDIYVVTEGMREDSNYLNNLNEIDANIKALIKILN